MLYLCCLAGLLHRRQQVSVAQVFAGLSGEHVAAAHYLGLEEPHSLHIYVV